MLLIFLASCSDMGEPEVLLPEIEMDLTPMAFSTVTIGTPQTRQFQITNIGDGMLLGELSLIQDSLAYQLAPQGSFQLEPGDGLTVEVTFTPQSESVYVGQIQVTSDDPATPILFIDLTGTGTALPAPALTLSETALDFGTVLTSASALSQITLSSTGTANLTVSSIEFDLTVYTVDITFPIDLAPGDSQVVIITFQPDGAGTFNGTMTIQSDSPSSPNVVDVTGAAEDPVSYATSIQPIWNSSCTSCHGSSGGLTLTSYSSLMSNDVITPGDAANSMLVKRIKGQVGSLMPLGGPALPTATISTIENWINQGALDN